MSVENKLGYMFRSKGLLEEAVTHPSCMKPYNNQRLEFLGDTVLGLMVADILFRLFPAEKEGDLAKRHAALVCGESLVRFVQEKDLAQYLQLSPNEQQSGGQENVGNLEDMCEALMAAVYLDGGMEAVEETFGAYWEMQARTVKAPPKDPKTALQEWAQARGLPLPVYTVAASEGPAHAPLFTVNVAIQDGVLCSATASTKRAAEREAARLLLEHVMETGDAHGR